MSDEDHAPGEDDQLQQHQQQPDEGDQGAEQRHAGDAAEAPCVPEGGSVEESGGSSNNNKRKLDQESLDDEPTAKRTNGSSGEEAVQTGEEQPAETAPEEPAPVAEQSEVIHVAGNLVGKLIGKAGSTVNELQARGGTHIEINHHGGHGETKAVTITGPSPSSIAVTKQLIQEVLHEGPAGGHGHAPGSKVVVPCPAHIVGRIIGRGGETIRTLQTTSNAHILINQDFPAG
jgi:far upstream element-binding protein